MTLQQIDDVLKRWRERLSLTAENLLEMQLDTTYQSLAGTAGLEKISLAGQTASIAEGALRRLNSLFVHFGLLQNTIDRAEKLRMGMPSFFGSEARLRAIESLLFTASIQLPASEVPLGARELLGGDRHQQQCTPEQLMTAMSQTFLEVRDAIQSVGQAWERFAAMEEDVQAELALLRSQTAMPGALLEPLLQKAEDHLNRRRGEGKSDPVGTMAELGSAVKAALEPARLALKTAEQVEAGLRAAQSQWAALGELHTQATASERLLLSQAQSSRVLPTVAAAETMQALHDWLNRLDRKRDEGAYSAVEVGLHRWRSAADSIVAADRAVIDACAVHVASRGELCGRLKALEAKARARGMATDTGFAALHANAETLLYTQPVHLPSAADAISRLEHRLTGLPDRQDNCAAGRA